MDINRTDNSYSYSYIYQTAMDDFSSNCYMSFIQPVLVVSIILWGCALFTNCIFLITMTKHSSLRKTSLGVYLMTLSYVDICISIYYIFEHFTVLYKSFLGIILSIDGLHLRTHVTFQPLSLVLILAIGVERYKAGRKSTQRTTTLTVCRKTQYLGAAICVASLGITVYNVIYTVTRRATFNRNCYQDTRLFAILYIPSIPHWEFYTIQLIIVMIDVIAIFISLFLSIMTYSDLTNPLTRQAHGTQYQKLSLNLFKMATMNTYIFLTCTFLYELFGLIRDGSLAVTLYEILPVVNSMVKPIIYCIIGTHYRKAFLETFPAFGCFNKRRNETSNSDTAVCVTVHHDRIAMHVANQIQA